MWGFYKDPEYKTVVDEIIRKYGGWLSILRIYLSLVPLKLRVIKRCLKMKKRWNYHDISKQDLKKSLRQLREEYNIELFPVNEIPAGKYLKSALPAD